MSNIDPMELGQQLGEIQQAVKDVSEDTGEIKLVMADGFEKINGRVRKVEINQAKILAVAGVLATLATFIAKYVL